MIVRVQDVRHGTSSRSHQTSQQRKEENEVLSYVFVKTGYNQVFATHLRLRLEGYACDDARTSRHIADGRQRWVGGRPHTGGRARAHPEAVNTVAGFPDVGVEVKGSIGAQSKRRLLFVRAVCVLRRAIHRHCPCS